MGLQAGCCFVSSVPATDTHFDHWLLTELVADKYSYQLDSL